MRIASLLVAPALAAALLAALPAAAQTPDTSKVEIKVVPVAGQVSILMGSGGNIGVSAGDDGLLMIDDQYEPMSDKIRAALAGLSKGKLKFIVNTHWHGDHTGGNKVFGPEAPIIAQSNVLKRMSTEQTIKFFNTTVPASPKEALPVITFDQSVSIHFNGEEIKVVHFPRGHTDGDSIIVFTKSNVVHMGDDFFNGMFPFVDIGSGGTVQGMADAVAKVLAMVPADAKIIPGHGNLGTVADLKAFHTMLVETSAIVKKGIQAKKSLGAIQAEGLGEKWKPWGAGMLDTKSWIAMVHESLTQDAGNGSAKKVTHENAPAKKPAAR